jgi:hypothetical protein
MRDLLFCAKYLLVAQYAPYSGPAERGQGDGFRHFLPTVPSPAQRLVLPADNAVFCRTNDRSRRIVSPVGGRAGFFRGERGGRAFLLAGCSPNIWLASGLLASQAVDLSVM